MSEKYISFDELLKSDKLSFVVDPAIEQRLMYHFQLKSASSNPKKNMIMPFISSLFSTKLVGLKIGMAGVFAIMVIGFNHMNAPKDMNILTDTASLYSTHDSLAKENDSILAH